MANTYKILGQSNPSATTSTDVYTVPAGKQAVISTISIANLTSVAASYRIALVPSGGTLSNQHYLAYDVTIAANDTTAMTLGLSLSAGDKVKVYASTSTVSFGVYGSEIS